MRMESMLLTEEQMSMSKVAELVNTTAAVGPWKRSRCPRASINGPPLKSLTVQIPQWMHDTITDRCKSLGIDRATFVTVALEEAMDQAKWNDAPSDTRITQPKRG
jgi:hypothetical protein